MRERSSTANLREYLGRNGTSRAHSGGVQITWFRIGVMNEAEWLACTHPMPMLECLRWKASDREMRLFAVACCRRIWHHLSNERSRRAVELAEAFADGFGNPEYIRETGCAVHEASRDKVNGANDAADRT